MNLTGQRSQLVASRHIVGSGPEIHQHYTSLPRQSKLERDPFSTHRLVHTDQVVSK